MKVVFTVVVMGLFYLLTIQTRNKKKIKRLSFEINELKQLLEMNLLYGKEKNKETEKGEASSTDSRLDS